MFVVIIVNRIFLGSFLKFTDVFGGRSTFMSAVDTLFFTMCCKVRPVLMYLIKAILASR